MTAAGEEPRRHHLLPRFYIDRWAVNNRVRVVDLRRGRTAYELAPENAAIETDFYRLEENDGMSPVYWEAWLSEVEGRAAAAFAAIDQHPLNELDDQKRQWLCLFLSVQMTRGRKTREQRRAMLAEELTQVLDMQGPGVLAEELRQGDLFSYGPDESVDTIMADVARFRQDPSQLPLTKDQDLKTFAHLATRVAGILMTRHMALYRTLRAIVTSDEPVVEMHEHMAAPALLGGVWGAPIYSFPIDPHTVLALYRRDIEPRRPGSTLSAGETLDLNVALASHAHSFIVARPGDRIGERLFLPDVPKRYRTERYVNAESGNTVIKFWAPGRWEGRADAPSRAVARWWPPVVPSATSPSEEEQAIMDAWT